MTSPASLFFAAVLLSIAPLARAQSATTPESTPQADSSLPRGASLGVAVIWSEGRMLGEDTRTFVVPTIGYEGERVFFRGINGGVHLFQRGGFELDAIIGARLEGWDAKDLDAKDLAAVGIDRALLQNRDIGLDAGLGLSWKGKAGKVSLSAKSDIVNASSGHEVALAYSSKPFAVGPGLLTSSLGVNLWSSALSDYYYGTLPAEEARGVPRYRLGSAVVPTIGVSYVQRLPSRWLMVAGAEYRWLPGKIVDSPLVDDSAGGLPSVFVGLSHSFGGQPR